MKFAQRLKALRLACGLTQKELSEAIGVSTVTIQYWERGEKKPSMDAIISLSKTLMVSADTILGLENDLPKRSFISSKSEATLLENYKSLDAFGQKAVRTVCAIERERVEKTSAERIISITDVQKPKHKDRYIPHYTTPSAAGSSMPLDGTDFEMMLVNDDVPAQADYAVNIQGNSMYPYIHDGDMVYVDKDAELRIGDVGIFCVDGAMYCKMYYLDENGNLILVSANPKLKHTNVFVSPDSGSDVRSCGKVIMNCRVNLPDYLFED